MDDNQQNLYPVEVLLKRRTGGSVNLKGIGFQLNYAMWKTLDFLDVTKKERKIRLEGIEDIDLIKIHLNASKEYEFIQVKYSENKLDSFTFWSKGILQNFLEVYLQITNVKFRFVHNMDITDGYLHDLSTYDISEKSLKYWHRKIEDFKVSDKARIWNWNDFDLEKFLSAIKFEKLSEPDIENKCIKHLIENLQLNVENEHQYLRALFYSIFKWSRDRETIRFDDLNSVIETVREDIAKGVINPAIQNKWISRVSFNKDVTIDVKDYYEGKSARPIHIAKGLPVKRINWEEKIENYFKDFDITVIKSSSGQGKSTLVWQVGKKLLETGYSLYELNWCSDEDKLGAIISFIVAKINIGESPIIVVDGLTQAVSKWSILAERCYNLPVKFMITSREEDWYRYGGDASRLSLGCLNIHMSCKEAQDIFTQFRQNRKLHRSIDNWQSAWEKVKEKGLLIEFIYLLTFGEMLKERLTKQIKNLNEEEDGAAKIEILRMVTLADICNIKLSSQNLIETIQKNIGVISDRNEVIKSLENEYYIKLDKVYVEGLHPVRSSHLSDLLHSNIPVANSLINLLPLIEKEYIYDFCFKAPLLITDTGKTYFYENIAIFLAQKSYFELVKSIEGIFSCTVIKHWESNREIYDDVFEHGGLLLVASDSCPWIKLNTIKKLVGIVPESQNPKYLLQKLNEIQSYNPKDYDIFIFLRSLQTQLEKKEINIECEGLGHLIQWFDKFQLHCPLINKISRRIILNSLKFSEIKDSCKLAYAYHSNQPKEYYKIVKKHKDEIISWLKRKTNTLNIEEDHNNIKINYLLYENIEKANDESVNRIFAIYAFLPFYKLYCTEAIIPPFPGKELFSNVLNTSIKRMPQQNIDPLFHAQINSIWVKVLMSRYESSSVYDWQKQWIYIRKKSLEFIKDCNRLFEALIEKNHSRIKSISKFINENILVLSKALITCKDLPNSNDVQVEETKFAKNCGKINEWADSLRNFVHQISNVIIPQNNKDQNLAIINLLNTKNNLYKMQQAFRFISESTFKYFHPDEMENEEVIWYDRAFKTISYYINNQESAIATTNAKTVVEKWWQELLSKRLDKIYIVLKKFEKETSFKTLMPKKIIEEGILKKIVIGISGVEFSRLADEFPKIIYSLVDLSEINVNFIIIVFVEDDKKCERAIRINNALLVKMKKIIDGENIKIDDEEQPLPIELTAEMLETLEGVELKEMKPNILTTNLMKLFLELWKLIECRRWLSSGNEIDKEWLSELVNEFKIKIEEYLDNLKVLLPESNYNDYKNLIAKIFNYKLNEVEFIEYFNHVMEYSQ